MSKKRCLRNPAQASWKALYSAFRAIDREEGDWHPDAVTARAIALMVASGAVPAGFALRVSRALASMTWTRTEPARPLAWVELRTARTRRVVEAFGYNPNTSTAIRGPRPWWV